MVNGFLVRDFSHESSQAPVCDAVFVQISAFLQSEIRPYIKLNRMVSIRSSLNFFFYLFLSTCNE